MKILLHICCSSCALYPVKITREERHDFTGFWFNPNIQPYEEYELRLNSLKGLADKWHIDMIYNTEETIQNSPLPPLAKGGNSGSPPLKKGPACPVGRDVGGFLDENHKLKVENFQFPNRPERCTSCYKMRLGKTAEEAQRQGFDAFSTTLLISPYQDFEQIISIGSELAEKHNVIFYFRDFRQYFREAMAYAKEMGLYRQKYCGCIYSREERLKKSKSEILNPKQYQITKIQNSKRV